MVDDTYVKKDETTVTVTTTSDVSKETLERELEMEYRRLAKIEKKNC